MKHETLPPEVPNVVLFLMKSFEAKKRRIKLNTVPKI